MQAPRGQCSTPVLLFDLENCLTQQRRCQLPNTMRGHPLMVNPCQSPSFWDSRGPSSSCSTFHNPVLYTKHPAQDLQINSVQITHRISLVFIKTITASILRKRCTGPNIATRLGICAILMKRETTWINILHWQLLPPLNSLKFTFTAAPESGHGDWFLLLGEKQGSNFFPRQVITVWSIKGTLSRSSLHGTPHSVPQKPSKSQSLHAIHVCHKEQWKIAIIIIRNSPDLQPCLLCFSPSPLEAFSPMAGLGQCGSLLLTNGQFQRQKTPHTCLSSFLQTHMGWQELIYLFLLAYQVCWLIDHG